MAHRRCRPPRTPAALPRPSVPARKRRMAPRPPRRRGRCHRIRASAAARPHLELGPCCARCRRRIGRGRPVPARSSKPSTAFLGEEYERLRPAPAIGTPIDHASLRPTTSARRDGPTAPRARPPAAPGSHPPCYALPRPTPSAQPGVAATRGTACATSSSPPTTPATCRPCSNPSSQPSASRPPATNGASDTDPGNAAHSHAWKSRAAATVMMLERIVLAGALENARPASEAIIVTAADAAHLADVVDKIVEQLRAAGCTVDRKSVDRSSSV